MNVKQAIFFIIVFSFVSNVNSQEVNEIQECDNTRVSVYLHPVSFAFNGIATYLYSTIEIPFSLSNSLIIKPSFWIYNGPRIDGWMWMNETREIYRFGGDIGMRHFLSGNGNGFYLQGQIGAFYYKGPIFYIFNSYCDETCSDSSNYGTSLWLDAMGYLGYSWKDSKISMFADIGFGIAMAGTRLQFLPDINIGIGIPF